jgi:hypothetical protein
MNRIRTALWIVPLSLAVQACGQPHSSGSPKVATVDRAVAKPVRDRELENALGELLVTKPSSLRAFVSADAEGDPPTERAKVELVYERENAFGFKLLTCRAVFDIVPEQTPRITVTAEYTDGDDVYKLITVSYDDKGNVLNSLISDNEKDKQRSLEDRCKEIRTAISNVLRKARHARM